jgi:excisionase family DNA binding protein
MSQETPRLYDIPGIVGYLQSVGATAATSTFVRGLINSGQIPYLKIGKAFYVSKAAVDAWLLKSERRTRS